METLCLIPARYASSRYPGKPLVPLEQPGGGTKSLIEMTWETAMAVPGLTRVMVATDDDRIAGAARGFGAEVVMTPAACRNGTERCAAALEVLDARPDIVVNLQGDAPLTPPWFVTDTVAALRADPGAAMATPVLAMEEATLAAFRADRAAGRVGGTTAVIGRGGRALYFSKEVLPYGAAPGAAFHHVGLYAYRPHGLAAYMAAPPCDIEDREGLEQLRFLHEGLGVACATVEARGRTFWELNNPEDVPRIEDALRRNAMIKEKDV
ncbi:3-deoxy-manno-octulosonate cytidylyltransferase [Wenxinia marina]|uniref:3-deoxy-manno-octulosonate cytidylyltransferase n=1 Tax=Wenxinia marina DSM 24838 TaxID=1123501 RepID=A0A0D0PJ08_9RHOB|nr:manno-octulosonate cytidylyltransferase [Wenxinia marina]KIQ71391.1 3-deoxy-manno-octulosonate cytidylyltransferase [Wenxinia marina DSM 24838]GGL79170.1 3-deoxy-manno-octulosonate cytidylyltransferase [Wenxinia marina]